MKRLIHIVGYAVRGGCETNCATFIRHTPGIDHHVIVLGRPGPMTDDWRGLDAGVSHHFALERGWWKFHRRIASLTDVLLADGVIVWAGIRLPLVLDALVRLGCPVVVHVGNPYERIPRIDWALAASERILARPRSVVAMACSHHVARTVRTAPYYRRFPLEVCFNPVEIPPANGQQIRALDPRQPARIGMVARLDSIKDHATLLRAFARVRAVWPKAELHLAGDGERRPNLEALARALGVEPAVTFHGSISDVPGFLRSLDLFCYLTTASEGMGNAVAEAFAHGLPCVLSELPVMREVAGEGDRTVHFTRADPALVAECIIALLGDEAERRRLSEAAWQRAHAAFAPDKVVGAYLHALQIQP